MHIYNKPISWQSLFKLARDTSTLHIAQISLDYGIGESYHRPLSFPFMEEQNSTVGIGKSDASILRPIVGFI